MKHFLFAILAVVCVGAASAQSTQKFTAAKHNEYGLTYSLPVTYFDICINAEKIIKTAGPYYKYAKKYLGINNPITENSQKIVIKDIDAKSVGEPDKDNQYLMQFKKGSSPYLILNEKGLPVAINKEPETEADDVETPTETTTSVLDNNAYASALPGELLMSESTAKRAELAANMIYKIRESRTAFITGEADQMPDGEALKVIIKQLDEQENTLMALFAGTTKSEPVVGTVRIHPTTEVADSIAFRISDYFGIVSSGDLSGSPVYLSLKITARGEMPVNEKGEAKRIPKNAVMYNIPGEARLTLNYEGEKILDKTLQVAQFGIQFGLDPNIFTDKKTPSFVTFYPETGAIKEIGTTAPLQAEE